MIALAHALVGEFPSLFARCRLARQRSPLSEVIVQVREGILTLAAMTGDNILLSHQSPVPGCRNDLFVLPAEPLVELKNMLAESIQLERCSRIQVLVRWTAQDKPGSRHVDLIKPERRHRVPDLPELADANREFLTALHECGRTVARDNGRFALTKIQIQGSAGRVIGTDSKCAILWTGFAFPFSEVFLVPALPVFGSKELARETDIRVGRTANHLVVAVGPWVLWLPIDSAARYPDVGRVIPRTEEATVVGIDEQDAAALLATLPGLPGANDEWRPVTLDLNGGAVVRAQGSESQAIREIYLTRSPVAGAAVAVALDRNHLRRVLTLGCHTIRARPGKPLVAEGPNRTVLVATLEDRAIVMASGTATRTSTDDANSPPSTVLPERNPVMKPPLSPEPSPQRDEHEDALAAAEDLRTALADATAKAGRLVTILKSGRKEKKALAAVWAGLKQLNLGPGGRL